MRKKENCVGWSLTGAYYTFQSQFQSFKHCLGVLQQTVLHVSNDSDGNKIHTHTAPTQSNCMICFSQAFEVHSDRRFMLWHLELVLKCRFGWRGIFILTQQNPCATYIYIKCWYSLYILQFKIFRSITSIKFHNAFYKHWYVIHSAVNKYIFQLLITFFILNLVCLVWHIQHVKDYYS